MLGISQAGVRQLLAGGIVIMSALHKVPYLVPAHQDVVAQWKMSQPATCHGVDLKLQLQMYSHDLFQL